MGSDNDSLLQIKNSIFNGTVKNTKNLQFLFTPFS